MSWCGFETCDGPPDALKRPLETRGVASFGGQFEQSGWCKCGLPQLKHENGDAACVDSQCGKHRTTIPVLLARIREQGGPDRVRAVLRMMERRYAE